MTTFNLSRPAARNDRGTLVDTIFQGVTLALAALGFLTVALSV